MNENIYGAAFSAICPVNGARISYEWRLHTADVVMVEDIYEALKSVPELGFHEPIADKLHELFGGVQVITALHHGVKITTIRGCKK